MVRAAKNLDERLLPQGWRDALRQLALFAAAYYGYQLVRGAVNGRVSTAAWNATKLIWVEHKLHIFVEPSIQAWATSKSWVIGIASWIYLDSHFVVTVGAVVFVYLFRNSAYYFMRNMFMVAMGIALVGYYAYPTAPPRLMPEWGFTDPVAHFTGISESSGPVHAFFNLYAAVPSMHVCFALMVGWSMARLVKPRLLKVAWALYPLLITFVVVATGNHFILDAVLGGLTAGLSALAAQWLLARARPTAWAFRPAGAERRPAGATA
jgi:membrane-associated phospholipid phosphatase